MFVIHLHFQLPFQEHFMSAWKTAESDKVSTYPARRETKDETKEECVAAKVAHVIEGKPLVLLQVTCKSIYNKALKLWSLIHTTLM